MFLNLVHLAVVDTTYTSGSAATQTASAATFGLIMLIALPLIVLAIVGMWKVFIKAGYSGWKSIIPIYNAVILFKMAGLNPWLVAVFLLGGIPVVGPIISLGLSIYFGLELAKAFGKSQLFGVVGLGLFSFIGFLMLGFGDAQYAGPARGTDVASSSTDLTPPPAAPQAPVAPPAAPPVA